MTIHFLDNPLHVGADTIAFCKLCIKSRPSERITSTPGHDDYRPPPAHDTTSLFLINFQGVELYNDQYTGVSFP